jgi:hypothetical protein
MKKMTFIALILLSITVYGSNPINIVVVNNSKIDNKTSSTQDIDIYLIGGQSNAVGAGYIQNIDNPKIVALTSEFTRPFKADQRVSLFYLKGWYDASFGSFAGLNSGEQESMWLPLTHCGNNSITFGPELGFGNRLMQLNPNFNIGIIKYASSGSSLQIDWNPGASRTDSTQWGSQFKWFVKAVDRGLAALRSSGKNPIIRGMLWQQGEADSGYDNYAIMLGHFIDRVREQWNVPNMRFVYGYVFPTNPTSPIRYAERDVDQNSGTKYAKNKAFVVWTQDLELRMNDPWVPDSTLKVDNVHFGTAGQLELGRRMAETMNTTINSGISAFVKINSQNLIESGIANLCEGDSVSFGFLPVLGSWSWVGPNNFTSTNREIKFQSVAPNQAGSYVVKYTNPGGIVFSQTFNINVNAKPTISPYVQIAGGAWSQLADNNVVEGQSIKFSPLPRVASGWSWTGPNGFKSTLREPSIPVVSKLNGGIYTVTYTNSTGCSDSFSFNITVNTTALNDLQGNGLNEVVVYPNPVHGSLFIKNAVNAHVSISDISGHEILNTNSETQASELALNVKDLPSGLYFIKIRNQNNTITRKFILQ